MPPIEEILREFRYRPRLAPEILREVVELSFEPFDGVRLEGVDGGPPKTGPLVVVLTSAREPVKAIIVDAPDGCDSAARLHWPRWAREVRARVGVDVLVLVVTADVTVERWARQPIHAPPDPPFEPYVIGPSSLPDDPDQPTPVLLLMTLAPRIARDA